MDRGSAGPFLVAQPLNLMRCEEVSLIPGGVPHGLSSSSESHHLSSSTCLLQGDCWWQWLVFSGSTDLFCGHLPWIRVFCPTWGHFLGCLPPTLWTRAALPFCILHRRSLGSGREAAKSMAGVRHRFTSVPAWLLLLCPGHLESARP